MGHALMTYSPDANGGYSVAVHENFADVTGIGSLGNTYVVPSAVDVSTATNGATTATGPGLGHRISRPVPRGSGSWAASCKAGVLARFLAAARPRLALPLPLAARLPLSPFG